MQMDINDWGFQYETFGFAGRPSTKYKQLPYSNTEFLNFFEGRKQKQELEAIRQDYFNRIDALPVTDEAGKTALFNELELKLKEKGASFDEIKKATNAKRKEKLTSGIESALNIFSTASQALGIGKKLPGETPTTSTSAQNYKSGGAAGEKKVPVWVWVASGAVVLGLGIFAIYKFRR